ncbi:MAG: chemotaxis protein CheX, partial [Deltaproteobacteria bacterium]|nr:chemotaxis protein CheX [Deltaproteobacteria bacterium]
LSISEVFEKMFFLFLEPPDDDEAGTYDMESSIRFDGSMKGEVRVLLSRNMAKAMVQNMLGLEEDKIIPQRVEDCAKEAVNMVCGYFLGRFDSTRVFTLSAPVFREPVGDLDLTEDACRLDFDSDGRKAGVIVAVD